MSSGLTALAAVVTYDFTKRLFPKLTDQSLSTISKFNTLVLGAISYLFIFAVERMGSVLPVS
jgi:Na+/proline symporter